MALAAERPDVLERLGSALNSSDLSPDGVRSMPVDLIGASGLAQINPEGRAHAEHETSQISPRTELGGVLVRLKAGGDRTLGNRAVYLLAAWVQAQKAYARWKIRPGRNDLLDRFARQALAEWLNPVCPNCLGRQVLGMDRGEIKERRVRCVPCKSSGRRFLRSPAGRLSAVQHQCPECHGMGLKTARKVVTTKPRTCNACHGTGTHRVSDAERALAMGVDQNVYRKHWAKRFSWMAGAFDRIEGTERNCLRVQLKSG